MAAYSNLDPDDLQELLRGTLVLIDVRTDREVERGLIPGALHIPLHMLPARMEEIARVSGGAKLKRELPNILCEDQTQ